MFSTDLTHHVQVSSLPAILVERCTGQDKKNGLILPAPIVKNSRYKYKQWHNSKSVQIAADFFSAGLKYKKRIFQPNTNSWWSRWCHTIFAHGVKIWKIKSIFIIFNKIDDQFLNRDQVEIFGTYHVRWFLSYNVWYLGAFLDPPTYPKIRRHLWTFP